MFRRKNLQHLKALERALHGTLAFRSYLLKKCRVVLHNKAFGGLNSPFPPLPEQRRIVTKLEELFTRLDAGVSELKKTQAQLKRYRQSVLKAACEGTLVPTEAELAAWLRQILARVVVNLARYYRAEARQLDRELRLGDLVPSSQALGGLIAASGTFGIRLQLPNPDYRLPAGLKCKVIFPAK